MMTPPYSPPTGSSQLRTPRTRPAAADMAQTRSTSPISPIRKAMSLAFLHPHHANAKAERRPSSGPVQLAQVAQAQPQPSSPRGPSPPLGSAARPMPSPTTSSSPSSSSPQSSGRLRHSISFTRRRPKPILTANSVSAAGGAAQRTSLAGSAVSENEEQELASTSYGSGPTSRAGATPSPDWNTATLRQRSFPSRLTRRISQVLSPPASEIMEISSPLDASEFAARRSSASSGNHIGIISGLVGRPRSSSASSSVNHGFSTRLSTPPARPPPSSVSLLDEDGSMPYADDGALAVTPLASLAALPSTAPHARFSRLARVASEESFRCRGLGLDDSSSIGGSSVHSHSSRSGQFPGPAARRMTLLGRSPGIDGDEESYRYYPPSCNEWGRRRSTHHRASLSLSAYTPSSLSVSRFSIATSEDHEVGSDVHDDVPQGAIGAVDGTDSALFAGRSLHEGEDGKAWPSSAALMFGSSLGSACPLTPPASIRLKLRYAGAVPASWLREPTTEQTTTTDSFKVPRASTASPDSEDDSNASLRPPVLLSPSSVSTASPSSMTPTPSCGPIDCSPSPPSAVFIHNGASTLELKEILAEQMRGKGFSVSPRDISLGIDYAPMSSGEAMTKAGSRPKAADLVSSPTITSATKGLGVVGPVTMVTESGLTQSSMDASALGLAFLDAESEAQHRLSAIDTDVRLAARCQELKNNDALLFETGLQDDDVLFVRVRSPYRGSFF